MNNNYYEYPYEYYNTNDLRNIAPLNYQSSPYYNYQNFRSIPTNQLNTGMRGGLLSRLFGGGASTAATNIGARGAEGAIASAGTKFSWSGLLNGASKTLGVINQAIPVVYQVKPIWNNAKTMFRVMKAVNNNDTSSRNNNNNSKTNSSNSNISNNSNTNTNKYDNNAPTFFD